MRMSKVFALSLVWLLVAPFAASARESLSKSDEEEPQQAEELGNLSLRDLLAVEVSSASRKLEPLSRTAAAIFVVSQEDIRRIVATSIPEALRIVPGFTSRASIPISGPSAHAALPVSLLTSC